MARLDYNPFPTVATPDRPPNDYLNIPTRPAQFGADIGAAVKEMGAEVTKIGHFYGQVAADQATNNWEDETNKILRGDPNKMGPDGQPDTGFFGLRGQAAMEAWPAVRNQLMAARQNARNSLMTAESTSTFDAQTRRLHFMTLQEGGAHFTREQTAWAGEVNKASVQNALLGIAAHPDDDAAFSNYTGDAMNAMMKQLQVTGGTKNPELVNHTIALARQHAIEARVDAWAPTNPGRGKEFLEANKDALPGAVYDKLNAKVTGHADTMAIGNAVNQAMGSVGGGAPAGGSTGGGQNNPGNIRVPGSTGTSKAAFQSFATPEEGVGAMRDLLLRYQDQHGLNTVRGIVSRYSPPSENRTDALVQSAAQTVGVGPDERIDLHDPATMQKMISATIKNEGTSVAPGVIQKVSKAAGEIKVADVSGRQGFAQAAGTSLDQILGNIDKQVGAGQLRPELAERAKAQAESRWRAHVIDTERVQTLQDKERRERQEGAADNYVKQMIKDPTQVNLDALTNDPNLDYKTREHLANAVLSSLKQDAGHDTKTYGPQFYDFYRRVHAPDGDPQKVTDPAQLYGHVGETGGLTVAGVDKLTNEIHARRTPEGEAESEMKKQFFAMAKGQITYENEDLHIVDPQGKERYLKFMAHALPMYDAGRRAGLSAAQLLDPDSKDYIGKIIDNFKPPPSQNVSDLLKDKEQPGIFSRMWHSFSTPTGPPAAAADYLRQHPELKDAFEQKYGAGTAAGILEGPAPAPAAPEAHPPIARP